MIKYDIDIKNLSNDKLDPNETYINGKGTIILTSMDYRITSHRVHILYSSCQDYVPYEIITLKEDGKDSWTPVDVTLKVRLKDYSY